MAASASAQTACVPTQTVTVRRPTEFPGTREGAYRLVQALASAEGPALVASLRPDSEDYAAVFDATLAGPMMDWASRFWDSTEAAHSVMLGDMQLARASASEPTEIALYALTPELLHHPGSELCGRAYVTSGVERHIAPGITVYCYGFRPVKEPVARLADALVYVHGHWAFFPRPNEVPKSIYNPQCPPLVTTDPTPLRIDPTTQVSPPQTDPSGPDAARAVLSRMIGNPAGVRELAKLEPTLADVRAVYREPAATRLYAAMKPKWDAVRRGSDWVDATHDGVLPSNDDDAVELYGSSADAIGGAESGCPTGYRSVAKYLEPNAFVYCFTFVRIGRSGMGMDGLVFANRHWVLIPRPWELGN